MSIVSSIRGADPLVRRLTLVNFLMQAGNQSVYFVGLIGTATYLFGADAYGVALLVAVINATYLVGSGLIGIVIDRMGPRKVLLWLLSCYAALTTAAVLAPPSYPLLVSGSGALGLLAGAASTTISAFPPYLVDDRTQLKDANSLVDTAVHLAIIVGPCAGGVIASLFSSTSVFVFSSFAMWLATLAARGLEERITPEKEVVEGASSGAAGEFIDGLRLTFTDPDLRFLFIVGFFGFFAYGAFDALESLFYRDVLSVDVEWMGYLSMLAGVGSVVGSAVLLRIPHEHVTFRLLVGTLLLTGIGSMVYVGTSLLPVAAVGQALTGMGFGLMMPVQHLLVQESCELSYLGRVTSVIRIGLNSSGVLPLLMSPILSELFGVQAVLFGASALVAAIALALAAILARRTRC